jgi:hypothetical protein
MTKVERLKLVRKLLLVVFLATGFGLITSTEVTPTASANALCCFCEAQLQDCITQCNTGYNPTWGCTSNCYTCCRNQTYFISHCFTTCVTTAGGGCDSDEQCPNGSRCEGTCSSTCD